MQEKNRCSWCLKDQTYIDYHDTEWGVPLYKKQPLFEMLILEGMQAGLSWLTILQKRAAFQKALLNFDPSALACCDESDLATLLQNPAIIRNRLKLESAILNARAFLEMEERGIDFSDYVWQFVEGTPIHNHWKELSEVPCLNALSEKMSKELRREGFRFVGPKICYSFMQATGMINDHLIDCFRHQEIKQEKAHRCTSI